MEHKDLDRLSYALGMSMGNNFRASGVNHLDAASFAAGVKAVFNPAEGEKPAMTYDEAKEIIKEFFTALEAKHQEKMQEVAKANAEMGNKYLKDNAKRPEVKTTPSGLQYEVLKEGHGPKPNAGDTVVVHYTGRLIDGTVFDSSVERGEPATFGVTQVIPGWVEALQMMPAGSSWRLFIPYDLAYGPNGAGGAIPPNATLIFDVELLKVQGRESKIII